jgi:uncharacterized protein YkwD
MNKYLFIFLFTQGLGFAQSAWQLEDYSKWNHNNFRQNQNFNRAFSTTNPDYLLLDAAIFFMTNEERAKIGVQPLRFHKSLEVAAYNHSMKMATTDFFSHQNSKDQSRYSTTDRGKLAGVFNPSFAENIAYNYPDMGSSYLQVAKKLIVQWMNSPGHKDNILSTKGRQMGIGTYFYDDKIYATQVFQWFSDVVESPNGSIDKLPQMFPNTELNSAKTENYNRNEDDYNNSSYTAIITPNQNELNKLRNQNSQLNRDNSDKQKTIEQLKIANSNYETKIGQLNQEISNLKNSNYQLQQQKSEKDAQYNKVLLEYETLTDKRTTVKKSKYNADEFHAITFKIGINTFYQSIGNNVLNQFDPILLSFGTESMIGFNFGESYKRNSIGLTLRVNQANQNLSNSLDSITHQPLQFFDAEITTIVHEWFSIGVGANLNRTYGSTNSQINPSVSLGLCFGPKNWKIQVTQQASVNSDSKINGRASFGIALRL